MFVKYPRTYHLPWSMGRSTDDKVLSDNELRLFDDRRVIITKKMDGENTSMYSDHIHARSIDSKGGTDRDWVKKFWAERAYNIPENWRICGENLWAKHSIHYTDLPSYFMGFSIWDETNTCLSWNETLHYFAIIGIEPVYVLYDGIWDLNICMDLENMLDPLQDEGYVVRIADAFHYDDFKYSVAKFVRQSHVTTHEHWRSQELIPNRLK